MASNQHELRRQVGIALRLPVVVLLGLLWAVCLWWWLAGIGVMAALAMVMLKPLAYPVLHLFTWLSLAFTNRNEEVLPGYWDRYPDVYFEWCDKSVKLGFSTLRHWLLEGFDS